VTVRVPPLLSQLPSTSTPSHPVNAIIERSFARQTAPALQYVFTAAGIVMIAVIRGTLITDLLPWLLFVPFILIVSLAYGRRPALFGLVLAALAAAVTLAGRLSDTLAAMQFWAATAVILAIGVMNIELGHSVRASFERHLRAEAQLKMLNHELAHRLKNNLAMVQGIAFQTLRQPISMSEARDGLNERLVALGLATDLLTQTSWEATDLRRIVEAAAKPLGADRFEIDGPAVAVGSQQALAFHELATNAVKVWRIVERERLRHGRVDAARS
jgi:signal transduction histidine kinase